MTSISKYMLALLLLIILSPVTLSQSIQNISEIEVSPNGKLVAGVGNDIVQVWTITGETLFDVTLGTYVADLSWSPNSERLVTISNDQYMRIWNVADGINPIGAVLAEIEIYQSVSEFFSSVDWSPDGNYIAVGGNGGTPNIQLWNGNTYFFEDNLRWNIDVSEIEWHPTIGENIIATILGEEGGSALKISTNDANQSPYILCETCSLDRYPTILDWNQFGNQIAIGYSDGSLFIVDSSTNNPDVIINTGGFINAISWNANGSLIATASVQNETYVIKLWDTSNGDFLAQIGNSHVVDFNPVSEEIVYVDTSSSLNLLAIIPISDILPDCDVNVTVDNIDALITEINYANNQATPQTLCLEGTYELTSSNNSGSDGANGLPVITGDVTLVGINGGATITRNSASQFRIAKVDTGGRLVLDGITISNGNPGSQNGGGIRNLGTLEIINSVITNNTSDSGGGIRNNDNATLIITDSTISNNTSTGNGGGVYSNTGSSTTITDSDFINNQANTTSGHGGAIFVNSPNFSITGGLLDTNVARNGGAIFFNQSASPTVNLTGVQITNNTATNHGGGVYVSTGTVVMDNVTISGNEADSIGGGIRNGADLTIQNNSIIQDNYGGDSQGGGITNYSSLTIHDTQLIGNYGDSVTFFGGAIYSDGTLIIDQDSLIDGTSATVSINARHGGGIYADGGTVTISDSQILNSVADGDGGGIRIRSGTTLNAAGVTLDNNIANDDGGGLANEGTFTFANGSISNNHATDRGGGVDSSNATNNFIHYSCIEGNTATNRTGVYSAASNFDATNNWWGSASGASSSQVNSNVVKTPFVNTSCLDAQAMGSSAMAAMQSSISSTMETVSAPYETSFDERSGWLRSGTWAQQTNGGQASTGWVVDATIRNMMSILEMPVFVNLGNNPSPRVRYSQRGTLSNNDTLVLEILPQGATTWTILDQQSNLSSDWTQRDIDLSTYRGQAVRLRWRLTTTGDVPAGQSSIDYAIDDLQITSRR